MSAQPGLYSCVGFISAVGGANLAAMEIYSPDAGSGNGFFLRSVAIVLTSANAAQWSLRRTTTKGITPTPINPAPFGRSNTPDTRFAIAWGTRPVFTGQSVIWGTAMPATIGSKDNITLSVGTDRQGYGRGVFVPPGFSIGIESVLATGDALITCIIEEI